MNIIQLLPTELVEAIAASIDESDVQAFVLTCRTFHACCSKYLREHQGLIAKYSYYDATSFRKSLQLLDDAWTRGFKAEYVKTLSIGPFAPARPGHVTHVLPEQFPVLMDKVIRFRSTISRSRYRTISPAIIQLLTSGGSDSVAALLMAKLRYLSTIILNGGGQDPYLFYEKIRRIAAVPKRDACNLSKLSRVVYQRREDDNETWLGSIEYLAEISSVKSITISNARSPFRFVRSQKRGNLQCPNISELYIDGGPIAPWDFGLLQDFTNLDVFSFVGRHARTTDAVSRKQPTFDESYPLIETLVANSGKTLRHLTLRFKSTKPHYVGELDGFWDLDTLEIDLNILVPEEELENPHAITVALPRRLERLCIHVCCDDENGGTFIALMQSLLYVAASRWMEFLADIKVVVQADADCFSRYSKRAMSALAFKYKGEGRKFTVELSENSFAEEDSEARTTSEKNRKKRDKKKRRKQKVSGHKHREG